MNTFRGYCNVTVKITEDGYQYIDEKSLVNQKPMIFDYKELQWLKDNLYGFVVKNYPAISKKTLDQIQTITVDELKLRPYVFTTYSHTFDEDTSLLKVIDTPADIYNIYIIKYQTMEGIYKNDEIIDHKLIQKIRFESENWYKNFFNSEEDYDKNRHSATNSNITQEETTQRKYSTLLENEEKEIYRTFEGKGYTYDEWKIFEDEYYKIYKEKRNKKGFWDNFFG